MMRFVMLVEIPDPEVIFGIMIAFFGGLFALYISYKIRPLIKRSEKYDPSYFERLEFYERQLIDMKIRLDSLDVNDIGIKSVDFKEFRSDLETRPIERGRLGQNPKRGHAHKSSTSEIENNSTVDYVLGLITAKSMTSRDIQIVSQRSREHISRLLKKLFQDGYVERNIKTKPFTYSITHKGRAKLGILKYLQETAA